MEERKQVPGTTYYAHHSTQWNGTYGLWHTIPHRSCEPNNTRKLSMVRTPEEQKRHMIVSLLRHLVFICPLRFKRCGPCTARRFWRRSPRFLRWEMLPPVSACEARHGNARAVCFLYVRQHVPDLTTWRGISSRLGSEEGQLY